MPSIAPVIFFNIGWMTHYQGVSQTDPIQGGGRYVAETQSGGEIFNFKPYRKRLYGYVQASRSSSIRLERLGAAASDNSVDGVTVVWTASHPTNKGTYVVGWYQNATIFRSYGELARRSDDTITIHHASAELTDGFLLPPDARTLAVPRGKGGMGQSNVWYAEQNVAFVREVQTYIKSYGRSGKPPELAGKKTGRTRQPDLLKRLAVEQQAITITWNHYAQLGYTLSSVEQENTGWDLEAVNGRVHLKLEVKGLSGQALSVEMTPNEYRKLNDKVHRSCYRICVVTEALTQPRLYLFAYIVEKDKWISESGHVLTFDEITSARAYCA